MNNYNILDSVMSALNPANLIKKLGIMLLFITTLAIDKVVVNLDSAFKNDTSWAIALYEAYREAIFRAFGTIYPLVLDIVTMQFNYLNSQAYGSIGIGVVFGFFLVYIFFQPVSLFFDLIDGQAKQGTSFVIRLLVTVLLVIGISAIVYYGFGETGISYNIQETINQTATNVTNSSDTAKAVIINMI